MSLHDMELEKRLVILDDDTFRDFVTLSTEVNARIRIESEKGTVVNKALWYKENLPPGIGAVQLSCSPVTSGSKTKIPPKMTEILSELTRTF